LVPVAQEGIEHTPENAGSTGLLPEGGAKSGGLGAREALRDADLHVWRDACPVVLSHDIQAGILAMVRTARGVVDCHGELDTGSWVTSLTAATCEG
jgi:hypothetical protein